MEIVFSNPPESVTLSECNLVNLIPQAEQFREQTCPLQELLPDPAGFLHPTGPAGLTGAGDGVQGAAGDGSGPPGQRGTLPLSGECPSICKINCDAVLESVDKNHGCFVFHRLP